MKRLLAALLTFFALLALTGCGGSSSDGPHLLLYYPVPSGGSPGGDAIVSRSVDWAANSTLPAEQQVRRVVSLLLEDSADGSLESPIPASTRLLACQVSAGAAWVDFSSAYGQLSGMELTIADYCVTLSLSDRGHLLRPHHRQRHGAYLPGQQHLSGRGRADDQSG